MVSVTFKFPKFLIKRYECSDITTEKATRNKFFEILNKLLSDENYHRFLENYSGWYLNLYLTNKQYKLIRNLKEKYGLTYNELVLLTLVYWYSVKGEEI